MTTEQPNRLSLTLVGVSKAIEMIGLGKFQVCLGASVGIVYAVVSWLHEKH